MKEKLLGKKDIMEMFNCGSAKALCILKSQAANGFKIGKFWYAKEKDILELIEIASMGCGGLELIY
jgi:hypothetical protein